MSKKKVLAQLPPQASPGGEDVSQRWAYELEALASVAEIVEVDASDRQAFAAAAREADALMTSWGVRFDAEMIGFLERCVVIGVGSVGVDMVDIEAATEAGIVQAIRERAVWSHPAFTRLPADSRAVLAMLSCGIPRSRSR